MLPELFTTGNSIHTEVDSDRIKVINAVQRKGIPQVHTNPALAGTNDVLPISTMFKQWQASAPTLHQYRPDEIEVMIHRRTGKIDKLKRHHIRFGKNQLPEHQCTVHGDITECYNTAESERKQISNHVVSDEPMTSDEKNESLMSSLDDQSYDSYNEDDDEDPADCLKCRSLKQKLDETREQVSARQNLICALTSLNNDQVAARRKLETELKELNQRLKNAEILYSTNIRTIRENLAVKKNQLPMLSQFTDSEEKIMELIEKSRNAFSVQRGDPDGMDATFTKQFKDTSISKIQRAIQNMSKQLDTFNLPTE